VFDTWLHRTHPVHGEFSHCMHRRATKRTSVTVASATMTGAVSGVKPSDPTLGRVDVDDAIGRRRVALDPRPEYSGSSVTSFSSWHATTHRPHPMQVLVSTTKPQRWAVGSYRAEIGSTFSMGPAAVMPVSQSNNRVEPARHGTATAPSRRTWRRDSCG
jgi:hypothetical protein